MHKETSETGGEKNSPPVEKEQPASSFEAELLDLKIQPNIESCPLQGPTPRTARALEMFLSVPCVTVPLHCCRKGKKAIKRTKLVSATLKEV